MSKDERRIQALREAITAERTGVVPQTESPIEAMAGSDVARHKRRIERQKEDSAPPLTQ